MSFSTGRDTSLIYYAKGSDIFGRPYYKNFDFYTTPHYTPIPEQCARWIRKKRSVYCGFDNFYEEISTGSKVNAGSHEYVELYSRYYNVSDSYLQTDSLIGYFRNDTAMRKVYFRKDMNSTEYTLYDFALGPNDYFDGMGYPFNYGITLSPLIIDSVQRTEWNYVEYDNPLYNGTHFRHRSYLEGIGGLQGFVLIHEGADLSDAGELISFCVCGQSIYPDANPANCFEITGLHNTVSQTPAIHLYPNPTTNILHLSFPDAGQYHARLIITDILGQEVYSSPISGTGTHDISQLAPGLYTWHINTEQGIIKTGKLIKQ